MTTAFAVTGDNTTGLEQLTQGSQELSALDKVLLISDDQFKLAQKIQLFMRYTITAFAVPLTVCNIVIFLQRGMRSSTGTYVVCMSFGQVIYTMISWGFDIYDGLFENPLVHYSFCVYYLYILVFIGVTTQRGTFVVTCIVSVERLYAVIRPFHIKEFLLSKYPLAFALGAYFLTAVWHTYILAKTVIITMKSKALGTVCAFTHTDLYLKTAEINNFFGLTAKFVLSYGSLFGQLVLNVLTIWALRRHRTYTKHMQTSANDNVTAQRQRQMTRTVLATTICYVTLAFPAIVHSIMQTIFAEVYNNSGRKYGKISDMVASLALNLSIFSSAVDFICFFSMSANYRKTFFMMFSRCRKPPELPANENKTETTQTA